MGTNKINHMQIMEELKMRRSASQSNPHRTYMGNSQFLPVNRQALKHALKVAEATDIDGWGLNLEALKGNEVNEIVFTPEQKLCTWEMSDRGDLVFNLVGNLYISFKPMVDAGTEVLSVSKTVQMEHYALDLETYTSLMPYWKYLQKNK